MYLVIKIEKFSKKQIFMFICKYKYKIVFKEPMNSYLALFPNTGNVIFEIPKFVILNIHRHKRSRALTQKTCSPAGHKPVSPLVGETIILSGIHALDCLPKENKV